MDESKNELMEKQENTQALPLNDPPHIIPSPENRQIKLGKAAAGFLVLMAALTFLSRAADSMTVPIVKTDSPKSSALTHEITLIGNVYSNKEIAAVADQGILVQDVPVRVGQSVKAGDPLIILDSTDINDKLTDLTLELQKLQLQIDNADIEVQKQAADIEYSISQKEDAVSRAEEDLKRIQEDNEKAIKRAKEDLDDSIERWEKAEHPGLSSYTMYGEGDEADQDEEDTANPYETEYRASRRALQDARAKQDQDLIDAQRKIEDAKQAVEDEKRRLEISTEETPNTLALDIELKNREIAKLSKYKNTGGIIAAKQDGRITSIKVSAGQRTTGETIATMTDENSGYRFEAELNEEQLKYISYGDEVAIKFKENDPPVTVTVDSLTPKTTEDGQNITQLVAELPEGVGSIGMQGTLTVTQKTENYNTCVPIEAVRQGGTGENYVLVVQSKDSIMGTEYYAEKVIVTILDQTPTRAAVSGALLKDSMVIVSSSKSISEGDRVRLGV